MPRRLPYRPGDWFYVPLARGGAVGLVARALSRGVLGYFYLVPRPPAPADLAKLRPEKAVLIADVGDPHLLDGSWPILGPSTDWHPEDWPMPRFSHRDVIDGAWYLRTYDDKHRLIAEEEVSEEVALRHPEDGTYGCDSLPIALEQVRVGGGTGIAPLTC